MNFYRTNDHRELMVQVWYPAQANPSAPRRSAFHEDQHRIAGFVASHGRESGQQTLCFPADVPNADSQANQTELNLDWLAAMGSFGNPRGLWFAAS
jgi:hypothetical protein